MANIDDLIRATARKIANQSDLNRAKDEMREVKKQLLLLPDVPSDFWQRVQTEFDGISDKFIRKANSSQDLDAMWAEANS